MDNAYLQLLADLGLKRLEPVDFEVIQLYQQYKKDRSAVPPDIRDFFDVLANRKSLSKPKDDEAFRFYLDDHET